VTVAGLATLALVIGGTLPAEPRRRLAHLVLQLVREPPLARRRMGLLWPALTTEIPEKQSRYSRPLSSQTFTPLARSMTIGATDFIKSVDATLAHRRIEPDWLTIEITESVLVHDSEEVMSRLGDLHSRGITLALDDFGTGSSLLSYQQRFPLDGLKLDHSFVSRLDSEAGDLTHARDEFERALQIDPRDARPIWRQIEEGVQHLVARGALPAQLRLLVRRRLVGRRARGA